MRHVVKRVQDEVFHVGRQHRAIGSQVFVVVHHLHFVDAHEFRIPSHQDGLQIAHGDVGVVGIFFAQNGEK